MRVDEPVEQRRAPRRVGAAADHSRALRPAGAPASSPAPAAARCWPRRRWSRASSPPRPPASPARRAAISTARWRGGSTWSAARNASSIVSRVDDDRVGLAPRSARSRRAAGRGRAAARASRRRTAAPATRRDLRREHVEADVRGDPVQPRAEQRAAVEGLAPAPRAQERLLHGVLGLLERAEHPVAVHVQLAPVALGERVERRFVAGPGRGDGGGGDLGHRYVKRRTRRNSSLRARRVGSGAMAGTADWDALERAVAGEVIVAGAPGYDDGAQAGDRPLPRRPAAGRGALPRARRRRRGARLRAHGRVGGHGAERRPLLRGPLVDRRRRRRRRAAGRRDGRRRRGDGGRRDPAGRPLRRARRARPHDRRRLRASRRDRGSHARRRARAPRPQARPHLRPAAGRPGRARRRTRPRLRRPPGRGAVLGAAWCGRRARRRRLLAGLQDPPRPGRHQLPARLAARGRRRGPRRLAGLGARRGATSSQPACC